MSKFQNYLKTFDITSTLTEEDIDKTLALLQISGPAASVKAGVIAVNAKLCRSLRRDVILFYSLANH